MSSRNVSYVAVILLVGLCASVVPVFDMWADVFAQDKSAVSTLVENSPLLALSSLILLTGGWLFRSDHGADFNRRVAMTTVGTVVGVGLLIALVILVQLRLQNDLKPFVIGADAVVIGAITGLALGIRTAQQAEATAEAAAQRDRFQALFDNVPNPIVGVEFVDDDPVVRAVNPAFTEIFGFDRRTIVGEDLTEFVLPEESTFDPTGRPMTTEEVGTGQEWDRDTITLETVDGRREFIRLTAPVERGPARDTYAIYIDMTAEQQRRERLRVLSRTLRHDIRNKLTVIQSGSRQLVTDLDDANAEWAGRIESAANELQAISERVRTVEQQIAGESDLVARDLTTVVREVANDVRVTYDCDISLQAPDSAYGQATDGFSTAVRAVVENAIEHNDTDVPTVAISVVESLDGDYYEVRVADDGPGIPADQIEVITGERVHSQTNHLMGLGLWTARWVLRNCEGELEFASNTPRGTIVTLRVPQVAAPGADTDSGIPSTVDPAETVDSDVSPSESDRVGD